MKDAIETLLTRRSIKKYNGKPIPENVLNKILEVGTYAPTAKNMQKPIIIVIQDKKVRAQIAEENAKIMGMEDFDPFYGAPVVLLVAAENCPTAVYDGSCVIDNMLNAAWALGVGSCWIHRAKEEVESSWGRELLASLGIEDEYEGIGHCALDYVDGDYPDVIPRKENRVFYLK